ncbi:MAG: hypothetical protein ACRCYT_00130 [Cetobacterium sp.]
MDGKKKVITKKFVFLFLFLTVILVKVVDKNISLIKYIQVSTDSNTSKEFKILMTKRS